MKAFLVPVKGGLIRIPNTKQIMPETGMLVELNSFWSRRIKDGSVLVFEKKSFVDKLDRREEMKKIKESEKEDDK